MKEKKTISKDKKNDSTNLNNLSILGSSEQEISEKILGISELVLQGYSEKEIAKQYVGVCHETLSRLKARNKELKDAIDISKAKYAIDSIKIIIDIMKNSPQEKLRLDAAKYVDEKLSKLKNQSDAPMNVCISFQDPSLSKTKEQIEKDLEDLNKED